MSRFLQLAIFTISALVLLPACSEDVSAPDAAQVPAMTLAQLTSAPETLDLPQQDYRLETYLSRDFMPVSPSDGRPLRASVTLVSADRQPIPGDVKLIYIWIVNGDRVWSTKFSDKPIVSDYAIQRLAGGGPKWGPDISVEVIVGVTIGSSELRLVRASAQPIHRTM